MHSRSRKSGHLQIAGSSTPGNAPSRHRPNPVTTTDQCVSFSDDRVQILQPEEYGWAISVLLNLHTLPRVFQAPIQRALLCLHYSPQLSDFFYVRPNSALSCSLESLRPLHYSLLSQEKFAFSCFISRSFVISVHYSAADVNDLYKRNFWALKDNLPPQLRVDAGNEIGDFMGCVCHSSSMHLWFGMQLSESAYILAQCLNALLLRIYSP